MDLAKACDCSNHELLITKLHAYRFNRAALKHIHSYFTEREQTVEINRSFSTLTCSSMGVPNYQGSIQGHSFSIYIHDFFYWVKDTEICNHADDTNILCVVQILIPS